jgi:hypothetical protein
MTPNLEGLCSIQLSYRANTSTAGKSKKNPGLTQTLFRGDANVAAPTCRLLFTFGQTIATFYGRKDRR